MQTVCLSKVEYNYYPSFGMMKKSQLSQMDRFVLEKCFPRFEQPNVQKFKDINSFYGICQEWIEKIPKTFRGKHSETGIQRELMLKDWFAYFSKECNTYSKSVQYMILNSITKSLKANDDTLPPIFNTKVLIDTIKKMQSDLENKKRDSFNFETEYRSNLRANMQSDEGELNGWIEIPSKEHDSENFAKNVERLKALSHKNWCTKSFNAEPYLEKGDIHIYYESGKPKAAVRFVGECIEEIQEARHNNTLSLQNYDIITEHIKGCKLNQHSKDIIEQFKRSKEKRDEILKTKFPNGIENYSVKEILEAFDTVCEENGDGTLTISEYGLPDSDIKFSDLGVSENDLFKVIKKIKGNASFITSDVTNLGILEEIGGDAVFTDSKLTSLNNLKKIGGSALFCASQVTDRGELQEVGGDILLMNSYLKDAYKIRVGGSKFY